MPAGPWNFHVDMAGVGGVRATLPDMVRYLEGQRGTRESRITPALARTQEQVASVGSHSMGMTWRILSIAINPNSHTIMIQMGYDSAGDFYPLKFDAVLRPKRNADGTYTFLVSAW